MNLVSNMELDLQLCLMEECLNHTCRHLHNTYHLNITLEIQVNPRSHRIWEDRLTFQILISIPSSVTWFNLVMVWDHLHLQPCLWATRLPCTNSHFHTPLIKVDRVAFHQVSEHHLRTLSSRTLNKTKARLTNSKSQTTISITITNDDSNMIFITLMCV